MQPNETYQLNNQKNNNNQQSTKAHGSQNEMENIKKTNFRWNEWRFKWIQLQKSKKNQVN